MTETPEAVEPTEPQDADPAGEQQAKQPEIDWKAEARKWEQRAKENKRALDEAAPKISDYDRLIEASKSDEERRAEELQRKAEEASRWQQEAERWRTASVSSRILALAATSEFADPEDAVNALAQPGKYLDAGGVIDEKAIKADLAALLERKPHYRRAAETPRPRVPAPNAHQGSGAGGAQKLDPRQEFAALLQAGLNR